MDRWGADRERVPVRPTVAHEVREWAAVAALVSHGFGVSLVPRFVRIPPSCPVVRVPLRDGPTPRRRLLTCIRRGSRDQRAIALGLDALAGAAARLVDGGARQVVPDVRTGGPVAAS